MSPLQNYHVTSSELSYAATPLSFHREDRVQIRIPAQWQHHCSDIIIVRSVQLGYGRQLRSMKSFSGKSSDYHRAERAISPVSSQ
jgi:hypothetical protein